MEFSRDFCCVVRKLLNGKKVIQVHEAIQIALRGAEQTGHLREAAILLGGVFLLGAGRKLNEQLF